MRLCRFNGDRLGVVDGDAVFDVTRALEALPTERWPLPHGDQLIRNLPTVRNAIEKARSNAARHAICEVALNSPVANPSKIVAAPANYVLHVQEGQRDPGIHHGVHDLITDGFDTPSDKYGLFLKASSSLIGPSEPVQLHFDGRRNDHEVEVVLVIGKQCKRVAKRDAWGVIAGYALGLDLTVRGGEDRSFRKSADTYAVLGPWLTTADEVHEPENIDFSLSVNAALRQSSNTKFLTASIPRIIEIATSCYTLYPGDLIYTGTPEGVGPIQPGDVMEVQSPVLGHMTVRVAERGS